MSLKARQFKGVAVGSSKGGAVFVSLKVIGGPKGDAAFGEPQGDWRSQGGCSFW